MNHLLIPISFILLILHEIKITIGRTRKKENNNVLNPKLPTPKDLINSIILSIIVADVSVIRVGFNIVGTKWYE